MQRGNVTAGTVVEITRAQLLALTTPPHGCVTIIVSNSEFGANWVKTPIRLFTGWRQGYAADTISVWEKSLPLNSRDAPSDLASAYEQQSPRLRRAMALMPLP